MRLSTRGRYGLHAMYVLGKNYEGEPISLNEISKITGLSNSYLEQLIRRLKKGGLVDSIRGSQGGYFLTKNPKDITIGDILRNLEDFFGTTECSTEEDYCPRQGSCPARGVWVEISNEITRKANEMTLDEMVKGKYRS
ncbi:RrF2 family transcriptional regulator [Miniphocaeibacter massiliensis]|uniref:RrF2 family transcriptional regulator n=1 Tax=Miniphocaeibacter massiliensis TaxID=2041841 RepID=UPI000C07A602|nr:Rrf2 family transcriptional regulator [Miniphocaeibacter massiliensis]